MKRNISELLDDIPMEDLDLTERTPLSARQIKERTMARLGEKKTISLRWISRVAVAAAVIMVMTMTACAVNNIITGEWFGGYFGSNLSDRQKEVVEKNGRTFTETLSDNGATITPISAISVEDIYYLHLRITAPEGVVLEDLEDGYNYDFEPGIFFKRYLLDGSQRRLHVTTYWGTSLHEVSCSHTVKTLPDDNPTDNVKEFVLILYNNDENSRLNGPGKKMLYIPGLYVHKKLEQKYCKEKLSGSFCLDMTNYVEDAENQKLEIDVKDLTFYNEQYDFTTTVEKLVITPLAVSRTFSATESNHWDIAPTGGSVRLVMKDGSSILVSDYSKYNYGKDEGYAVISEITRIDGWKFGEKNERWIGFAGDRTFLLPEPIVLEDIDYIVIANEHTIDVN